jgi:tetratricopeptide (TPR) repeat protein
LAALLGLVLLAVGANVVWWVNKPALEPLPAVPTGKMDEEVRNRIGNASFNLGLHVRDASAWGDLGAIFFVHGFEAQSQVCFRNAERLDPGDYRWPYLLAVSLIYTDADEMIAAYQRAALRCGRQAHVRLRLAEALLDRGELDEADVQVQRVLADSPSNHRAQLAKARVLFAQGDFAEARTWAERSADGSGKRAPYLLLAQLCRRLRDAEGEAKAVAALQKIPDGFTPWDDPDITALRKDRATRVATPENLTQSGDAAMAMGILREIAVKSDAPSAATSLAGPLIQEDKLSDAEALLSSQLSTSPSDERLRFLFGGVYYQQKKYSEAEAEYRRVIELKPDNVDAWFNLGLSLLKLGKPTEARDAFATTIRISPSRVSARINLAELLLAEGKNEQAIEHLEAAIKLAPKEQQVRDLLARAKAARK